MFVPRFVPLVLTGLLATPAAAGAVSAPSTPDGAATPSAVAPTFQRLGGADRYATAAAAALAARPSGATTAVIARGDEFPDALAAAPLVAQVHGVLLLTAPNALPTATSNALSQLGIRSVFILGGDAAVSPAVEAQLRTHYAVQRIAGSDRYGTAAAVAEKVASLGAIRTVGGQPAAFFATGSNYPDAVVAGAPAAAGAPIPILLVEQNAIPAATVSAMRALHIGSGWILGGEAAVSATTQVGLRSLGAGVVRLGGASRQATAVAVARTFFGGATRVVFARGDEFPDALAAGPYAGGVGAPVLLTNNSAVLGAVPEDAELASHAATGTSAAVTVIGGTGAVTDAVGAAAAAAAAGIPPTTDCAAQTFVGLSPAQRVGQLFMIGVSAASGPDSTTSAAFGTSHIGNVILTGRSSAGVTATRGIVNRVKTLATTAATGGIRPFVSTDQEGGEVQVLSGPGFSTMPTALTQGGFPVARLQNDGLIWGRQLASAGVNVNLAPVADVVPPQDPTSNQPIGRYYREFGYTPSVVAPHVVAFASGMDAAGVAATLKHFPGLGRASGNTDVTAGVKDTVTTINDPYLSPFDAGVRAGAPWVMISSAIYTRIDASTVAMFSPTIVSGLLRGTLGFGGVIVSDSLNAEALVATPVGSRAADFIAAGGDMALVTVPSTAASMVQGVTARSASDATFRLRVNDAALDVLRAKAGAGLLPCS